MNQDRQRELWEEEHRKPFVFPAVDDRDASGGVKKFFQFIEKNMPSAGIEMGCGKGRNSIWLAEHGIKMTAFDFSQTAVEEAKKRAKENNVEFYVHDAVKKWPFESDYFDFGIDCFASTDIESKEARAFSRDEFKRVLKKGGLLLVYTLSTDDEFHKEMMEKHPASEKNSFTYPSTGKFEKLFDRQELLEFYKDFKLVEEQRIEKDAEFFGKKYNCRHFWLVLQKI